MTWVKRTTAFFDVGRSADFHLLGGPEGAARFVFPDQSSHVGRVHEIGGQTVCGRANTYDL